MTVSPDGRTIFRTRSLSGSRMRTSDTRTEAPQGLRLTLRTERYTPSLPARMLRPATAVASSASGGPVPGRRLPTLGLDVSGKRLLAAQLDLSFAVDPDDLHEDHVALVDHVLDALDPMGLELRDVDQAVF